MESIVYQNQEIKRWDVGPSTFLALPEKGARLLNWHINMSDGSVRDVIHWPEEPDCDSFAQTHGGIPVLFPFAGKCYDSGNENRWRFGQNIYPMPMHGFARESDFRIRSMDKHGFEVELEQTKEMKSFYPFDFTFTVIYHFLELSLQISLVLENEGRESIPWSAGLHPYFQIPWRKNLGLVDHQLAINAKQIFQYEESGMMKKNSDVGDTCLLNDNELINRVYYELKNPTAEISLLNNEEPIRISEVGGAQNGSRLTFVTWTKEGAPFYCLEPWMSPPNAPENKTCRMVPAGARDEFTVEIELA
jgi:galactose mutarotase-like enzyme